MKKIKLNSLNLCLPDISAASSLLNTAGRIFVCCDDQYALYELENNESWIQHPWPLAPHLPVDKTERKKIKPDFEALLGPLNNDNTILLIPSGSKANRTKAFRFNLVEQSFVLLDMSEFFLNLSHRVELINLEGAAVFEQNYLFMNRGIGSNLSSLISVNPKSFVINDIFPIDFGCINGVGLHGSELCLFKNYLFVLAVAEASPNSYDDGEILGSSLVKLSLDNFQILDQWIFDLPIKAEGLCRWQDKWLMASDPDGIGLSEFFSFDLP